MPQAVHLLNRNTFRPCNFKHVHGAKRVPCSMCIYRGFDLYSQSNYCNLYVYLVCSKPSGCVAALLVGLHCIVDNDCVCTAPCRQRFLGSPRPFDLCFEQPANVRGPSFEKNL